MTVLMNLVLLLAIVASLLVVMVLLALPSYVNQRAIDRSKRDRI